MTRPVEIAGGGVAGLALGLALRRADIPVRVHEAGVYPRHRLCGEFVSGAGEEEFARLGVTDVLRDSALLTDAVWFRGDRLLLRRDLPVPARGISRYRLDAALAARLTELGGTVVCEDRITAAPPAEGWVMATGRPRVEAGPWLAQKSHYQNLPMEAGLEMHLGHGGYTGIARVEGGAANVCALFPAALGKLSAQALPERLRANGLPALASRLESAQPVEASRCGVSHFLTGWQPAAGNVLTVGDHCAIIPPFTGHGMSLAVLAALEAAPHVERWSRGKSSWQETVQAVRVALFRKFHARLRWAARLHPFLLHPAGQLAVAFLARCGLLPWRWLYQKVR